MSKSNERQKRKTIDTENSESKTSQYKHRDLEKKTMSCDKVSKNLSNSKETKVEKLSFG